MRRDGDRSGFAVRKSRLARPRVSRWRRPSELPGSHARHRSPSEQGISRHAEHTTGRQEIGGPGPGPGLGGRLDGPGPDDLGARPLLGHRGRAPAPAGSPGSSATGPARYRAWGRGVSAASGGGVDSLRSGPRTGAVTFGPGVDVSFPNDPYLVPFLLPETTPNPIEGKPRPRSPRTCSRTPGRSPTRRNGAWPCGRSPTARSPAINWSWPTTRWRRRSPPPRR